MEAQSGSIIHARTSSFFNEQVGPTLPRHAHQLGQGRKTVSRVVCRSSKLRPPSSSRRAPLLFTKSNRSAIFRRYVIAGCVEKNFVLRIETFSHAHSRARFACVVRTHWHRERAHCAGGAMGRALGLIFVPCNRRWWQRPAGIVVSDTAVC